MDATSTLPRLVDCDAIFSSLAQHTFPLTGFQRRRIVELRKQGCRLWRIAQETGLPEHLVAGVLVEKRMAMFSTLEKERRT